MKTEYLLTYPDVQKLLAVPKGVLAKLVHFRKIPHIKIGRRVRFDPKEIAAWLEAQRIPPNAPR